jgi:hypothetical protein
MEDNEFVQFKLRVKLGLKKKIEAEALERGISANALAVECLTALYGESLIERLIARLEKSRTPNHVNG